VLRPDSTAKHKKAYPKSYDPATITFVGRDEQNGIRALIAAGKRFEWEGPSSFQGGPLIQFVKFSWVLAVPAKRAKEDHKPPADGRLKFVDPIALFSEGPVAFAGSLF
jgi:hypothetical protein